MALVGICRKINIVFFQVRIDSLSFQVQSVEIHEYRELELADCGVIIMNRLITMLDLKINTLKY